MKKLGILTLPMILAMAVSGCAKESSGSSKSGGSEFKDIENVSLEDIRSVEFKEEKVFDDLEYARLEKAATYFADTYHDFTHFYGNLYSNYSGSYENSTRHGYSYNINMGKNYYMFDSYMVSSNGSMVSRTPYGTRVAVFKKGVEYFYNSNNSYGNEYWTYTDVTQEDFEEEMLEELSYQKSHIYYRYIWEMLSEMFEKAHYGYGTIKCGVLANGDYALMLSAPNHVYYSMSYTFNEKTYIAHDYVSTDIVLTYKKDSKGNVTIVSGYCEDGSYYDYQYIDGDRVPMEEGKLFFYGAEYYGFQGNSTKDLGVDHYLAMFPKVRQNVVLNLETFTLSEENKLTNPVNNVCYPNKDYDGVWKFILPIPTSTPFKVLYHVEQLKLKNGEYVPDEQEYMGEITKLAVIFGFKVERREDADGEEYFFIIPEEGTLGIKYNFKVDVKKTEAVSLSNPVASPYIY